MSSGPGGGTAIGKWVHPWLRSPKTVAVVSLGKLGAGIVPVGAPRTGELLDDERTQAARMWAGRAAQERASAMCLNELAGSLMVDPATQELQLRALRAAQDELRHAELCRRLAVGYAGWDLPCPVITKQAPRVPDKVLTAFEHGCLRLGAEFAVWRVCRELATDAAVLRTLDSLLADEREHVELGFDVLGSLMSAERSRLTHCASASVASVVHSIAEELAELPLSGLPGHGCPDAELLSAVVCDAFAEIVWPGMEQAGIDPSSCAAWFADHGQPLLLGACLGGLVQVKGRQALAV